MKKIISLTVLLMLSVFAFAQEKKSAGQRADEFTARVDQQLSLSARQRKDVHRLALQKEQKLEALHFQKGMRKELMDQQRRQINTDFQSGMKKTLTAKQYEQWMKHKKIKARVAARHAKVPAGTMYREKNPGK